MVDVVRIAHEIASRDGALVSNAFFVTDLGDVERKYREWVSALPRVAPFYAVKCNPDGRILDTLAAAGAGFDCASMAEMEAVVARGVPRRRMIYAHPCKPVSHLLYAKSVGVEMMTFDNADELAKIKTHYPAAKLVLRVLVDDSFSTCRLGTKFGVPADEACALLARAHAAGLTVIGVSFHVGSGCTNAKAFSAAVACVAPIFQHGRDLGFPMRLLDLGGGFPGTEDAPVRFADIAAELTRALDAHFPAADHAELRVIAEPGRYFVASAASLAVSVTSKRVSPRSPHVAYYLNDGVYGSFNCLIFDHITLRPQVLLAARPGAEETACTIWGPTCDSMDCIAKDTRLPELAVGDWLLFRNMGAYTSASSSTFNGFARPDVHYVRSVAEVAPAAEKSRALAVEDDEGHASAPSDDEDDTAAIPARCRTAAEETPTGLVCIKC